MYVSCSQSPGAARAAGSCAFPLSSALTPGSYELRLLANNGYTQLATSGASIMSATSTATSSSATSSTSPSTAFSAPCDYYATPTGAASNSGLSPQKPFRPQDFWGLARPGKTLCLMDGTYRGDAFMLAPAQQGQPAPFGTQASPITVRALNDGNVLIDGQGVRAPVWMYEGNWVVFEGFNACCSGEHVVRLSSSNTTVRRVVAWDAKDDPANSFHVFNVTFGTNNVLEDVAGFGRGRKIFQFIGTTTSGTVCRRCWGRWDGYESTVSQPRATIQPSYNAPDSLVENAMMTWSGELGGMITGENIVGVDNQAPGTLRILGSVSYLKASAASVPSDRLWGNNNRSVTGSTTVMQDVIAVFEPGGYTSKLGFWLFNAAGTNSITRASSWGGSGTTDIADQWTQTNVCA